MALFGAMALNFWVQPSWLKIDFKSNFSHEGGTQRFRATAQNKAI